MQSYSDEIIQLSIQSINHNMYENHSTYHEGDAGLDLFFVEDQEFEPHSLGNTIKFGIKCEMFKGIEHISPFGRSYTRSKSMSYMLVPRSSISKTPLRMSNSIGIIDAGYRGEIMAKVDNLSNEIFSVKKGERLFQLIHPSLKSFSVKCVDELSMTTRGEGGFGSTN